MFNKEEGPPRSLLASELFIHAVIFVVHYCIFSLNLIFIGKINFMVRDFSNLFLFLFSAERFGERISGN